MGGIMFSTLTYFCPLKMQIFFSADHSGVLVRDPAPERGPHADHHGRTAYRRHNSGAADLPGRRRCLVPGYVNYMYICIQHPPS